MGDAGISTRWTDPFENTVCTKNEAVYETLPVMDGNLMTGEGTIAGGYFCTSDGMPISARDYRFTEAGEGTALANYGLIRVVLKERGMEIHSDGDFCLQWRVGRSDRHMPSCTFRNEKEAVLSYRGMEYGIRLERGVFGDNRISSEDNTVDIQF
jgi:hypothetical protein